MTPPNPRSSEMSMAWKPDPNIQQIAYQPPDNREYNQRRVSSASVDIRGATAIDLVHQAAAMMKGIENQAAETSARAQDLAQKAVEQLHAAEARIRALTSAQGEAEARLKETTARADAFEQMARTTQAQIAAMEQRVAATEDRARQAATRATEAENNLVRVQNAIQHQLLAKVQPSMGRQVAAA